MTETWYEVSSWKDEIKPVHVVSRTEEFITFKEVDWQGKECNLRRAIKRNFFPSEQDAIDFLLNYREKEVKQATDELSDAKGRLAELRKKIAAGSLVKKQPARPNSRDAAKE